MLQQQKTTTHGGTGCEDTTSIDRPTRPGVQLCKVGQNVANILWAVEKSVTDRRGEIAEMGGAKKRRVEHFWPIFPLLTKKTKKHQVKMEVEPLLVVSENRKWRIIMLNH